MPMSDEGLRRGLGALGGGGAPAPPGRAAGARLAIGSIQIRVQPGVTPSASLPPVEPKALGEPLSPEAAIAQAGVAPARPAGPTPDEAHLVASGVRGPRL